MAAIQVPFSLRTSTNVKTVHLIGNWDGYKGQLPMSRDSKAGSWKGIFRFQQSTLVPGKRYWYYYIMDGHHVSHDPAKPATKEPTTGRQLNILDVPGTTSSKTSTSASVKHRQGLGIEIPTGRGISPSRILHPKPSKPYASRGIREADYSRSPVDEITSSLSHTRIYGSDEDDYPISPASAGSGSTFSSRSGGSSPSSLSSLSDRSAGSCRCNRYGITRRGEKVRLDCGGSRCGYSDDSSNCSSEDSSEDDRPVVRRSEPTRREAPVIKPKPKSKSSSSVSYEVIRPSKGSATASRRR